MRKHSFWAGVFIPAVLMAVPALAAPDLVVVNIGGSHQHNFALKTDVYIAACGAPDGLWHFQITAPGSATALKTGDFSVSGGYISGGIGNNPCGPGLGTSLQLGTFPDSPRPNHGCVYKVWISQNDSFPANASLTKTFKTCNTGEPPQEVNSVLSGAKYYDGDQNGMLGAGEDGIPGVTIHVTHGAIAADVVTDSFGVWSLEIPSDQSFLACEDLSTLDPNPALWKQTGPLLTATDGGATVTTVNMVRCWTGPAGEDHANLDFGNVASVVGHKYLDTNADGDKDGGPGEPAGVSGFRILYCFAGDNCATQTHQILTGAGGQYSFDLPEIDSGYTVCEQKPGNWVQTGPPNGATAGDGTATAGSSLCANPAPRGWTGTGPAQDLYFLNVCLGEGGGMTLGFWSNKNGEKLFGAGDLALLVSLNLRNANGTAFDPASYAAFRTWILNASATNMAYMLSAQLAAMELNVLNGKVSASAVIYAPGTTSADGFGFATVGAVMDEANTSLGSFGLTLSGNAERPHQEALKNALDNANNNKNFVQTGCTTASY